MIAFPKAPKGFYPLPTSAKEMLSSCESAINLPNDVIKKRFAGIDKAIFRATLVGISDWVRAKQRTLFISSDVVKACENTEHLNDLRASDLRMPYPSWMFRFQHLLFGDIVSVFFSYDSENDKLLALMMYCSEAGFSVIELASWSTSILGNAMSQLIDFPSESKPPTGSFDAAKGVMSISFNLILLMQAHPEYIVTSKTKINRGDGKCIKFDAEEIVLPSRLRQMIQVSRDKPTPSNGHHSGPTPHWRRGHWRRQPHGKRWAIENPNAHVTKDHLERECHMVWLEPMFIQPRVNEESIA